MLGALGFRRVLHASSPEEALEVWTVHQDQISLVISDFVMPGLTGDLITLQMQKEKPTVRILIISGNDPGTLDSVIPLHRGVNFLQKPFNISDIRKSMEGLALPA
jgi:YesN/AraC family two-component response regulator